MFSKLATFRRPGPADGSAVATADRPEPVGHDTIEIALPAAMLTRFVASLARSTGATPSGSAPPPGQAATASPDALERLLVAAIAGEAGAGLPRVTRSPAGLYSPEYWRIALRDADPVGIAVVSRAARGILGPA